MSETIDNLLPPDKDVLPFAWWNVVGIVDAFGKERDIEFKRATPLP